MASSSSSRQQNQELNAFSGIEPAGERRKVSESSTVFDVFINHRGPDVKETLATQLYNSLKQLGIRAFLDSEEKELGNSFPSIIETAIWSAKVHIAIFSKRYAESAWCLNELVLMLKSKAKIIPVFYKVKPSDLRYIEKGAYAEAFDQHEKKGRYDERQLNAWKEALQKLSLTAGEEFNSDCQEIVTAVEKEVQRRTFLHVAEHPVGLNRLVEDFERHSLSERVEDFENKSGLKNAKNKAKVVGIFGMGGLGKTTLAKELSNRKKSNYNKSSFLFDVREADKASQLHCLQYRLLKDLFEFNKEQSFISADEGKSYLKEHIKRSPRSDFLIVVDDVDNLEQLNALAVMDFFKKCDNCLIIVTTRDEGVLITAGITDRYCLQEMNRNDGRKLFCWHAFNQPDPSSGYEELVDAFVDVCAGLPLSLQVLGRDVHNRPERYWGSQLSKVKEVLHKDIKQRLKISFESLDDEEKQVFMDVACFFLGEPRDVAESVLKASRWNAYNAIETLKDKCLLKEESVHYLSVESVLRMHDHLRDLGRKLADELSAPRRLWRPQYLKSLESMGFEAILAKTNSNVRCFHSIFDNSMFCQVKFFLGQLDISFETSASLLWLKLDGIKQPSIPSWIPLQNLQYLEVENGGIKTLWENRVQSIQSCGGSQGATGTNDLTELRELIINWWPELEELPSLSRVNKMEKFVITDCEKIKNITLPTTLISLSIQNCKGLQRVTGTGDLTELRELNIAWCPELEGLPSISRLNKMEKFEISDCEKIKNITLPAKLTSLYIESCEGLQRVTGTGDLTEFRELKIRECPELEGLPSISRLNKMEKFEIRACEKIKNITLPAELTSLSIRSCEGLQRVTGTGDLTELRELKITVS